MKLSFGNPPGSIVHAIACGRLCHLPGQTTERKTKLKRIK